LSLKLILSNYKTTQSLAKITAKARKRFPQPLQRVCKKLGLSKDIFIITTHKKPLALTAGLFFPKIIFSQTLIQKLNYKELEAVVLHEVYHQQHKHGLLYIIAEAISFSLSFLLPILRDVNDNMKLEFENVADRHALVYQGNPLHIASALNKLSGQAFQSQFPSFASVVDQRLELLELEHHRKLSFSKKNVLLSTIALLLLSFFAIMPIARTQTTAQALESEQCSQQNVCSDLCTYQFNIGMSRQRNSSSILPASMF
jgi:beta-lactamase regulating signal transducer with metallopeptidase domain